MHVAVSCLISEKIFLTFRFAFRFAIAAIFCAALEIIVEASSLISKPILTGSILTTDFYLVFFFLFKPGNVIMSLRHKAELGVRDNGKNIIRNYEPNAKQETWSRLLILIEKPEKNVNMILGKHIYFY